MSSSHESERRESHLTQHEHLELVTDTILAAVDLAGKLPLHHDADQSVRELYIDEQLPADLKLPQCWSNIYEPLTSLTVRYTRRHDEPHSELALLARFGDDAWQSILSRPSQPVTDNTSFTGETAQTLSQFGPRQREASTEYTASASLEEVTALLSSLVHAHSFQNEEQPITDPTEASQAAAISDTLEYALNAHSITTNRYDFTIGDERYEIITESEKNRISSIQIGHILLDDVVFDGDMPKVALDKLVANIELEDFQQAIKFYTEMEDAVVAETNIDPEMVYEIKRIIEVIERRFERSTELPFEVDDDIASQEKQHRRYGSASPDIDDDDTIPPTEQ
jgi:hypothetical protein